MPNYKKTGIKKYCASVKTERCVSCGKVASRNSFLCSRCKKLHYLKDYYIRTERYKKKKKPEHCSICESEDNVGLISGLCLECRRLRKLEQNRDSSAFRSFLRERDYAEKKES